MLFKLLNFPEAYLIGVASQAAGIPESQKPRLFQPLSHSRTSARFCSLDVAISEISGKASILELISELSMIEASPSASSP